MEPEEFEEFINSISEESELIVADMEFLFEEAEAEVEREAISEFRAEALSSREKFTSWIVKGVKGVNTLVSLSVGIVALYNMFSRAADQSEQTGQRISLSSAIDGAKQVLADKHNETVIEPIKKYMETSDFSDLKEKNPTEAKKIEALVDEPGNIYWAVNADDIMAKMAEMPMYTPN